jgi:Phospholipase_D-nuclease N-terminal
MDLWDVMVSIFWFMLLVAWFSLLFSIITDVFRDRDMSGWAKAGWCTFVILLPWLGVFVYLIVRGRSMGERASWAGGRYGDSYGGYGGYGAAGSAHAGGGIAGEISRLADMREKGLLTSEEYDSAKAQVLGTATAPAMATRPAESSTLPA